MEEEEPKGNRRKKRDIHQGEEEDELYDSDDLGEMDSDCDSEMEK